MSKNKSLEYINRTPHSRHERSTNSLKRVLAVGALVVGGGLLVNKVMHTVEASTGPAPVADTGGNVLPPTTAGYLTKEIIYSVDSKKPGQKIKAIMGNDESYLANAILRATPHKGHKITQEVINTATVQLENATKTSAEYLGVAEAGNIQHNQPLEMKVAPNTDLKDLEIYAQQEGITVTPVG